MKAMKLFKVCLLPVFLALTFNACAGPQTKDFIGLAESGILFAEQAPKVYDYAFGQEVNADSAKIVGDRRTAIDLRAPADALVKALQDRNGLFLDRLEQFNLMKKHAILLRSYFKGLRALSTGKDAEKAGQAAASIATRLEGLVPQIGGIKVLSTPISSLFQPVTKFAVEALRNEYLKRHLKQHGHTIWNAIGLQKEMFLILRNIEIEGDRKAWRKREKQELAQPLKDLENELPANWSQQRLALLTVSPSESPLSATVHAAEELQQNLKYLALNQENTLDQLERSIIWVDALIEAFEKVQGGEKK